MRDDPKSWSWHRFGSSGRRKFVLDKAVVQGDVRAKLPLLCRSQASPIPFALVLLFLFARFCTEVGAVHPESPEVKALVEPALAFLETRTDDRLGGKCLVALAFHKAGRPDDHPRIVEALDACKTMASSERASTYIYSKALAVIFLIEMGGGKHRDLVHQYVEMIADHKRPGAGYGYAIEGYPRGDTSQTQYAALCYWEMLRIGIRPDVRDVEECLNWILRTQDPSGAWGYEPNEPKGEALIEQPLTSPSMLSAGLSSALICGHILGMLAPGSASVESPAAAFVGGPTPPALRRVEDSERRQTPRLQSTGAVDRKRLLQASSMGRKWFEANFSPNNKGAYPGYYLYTLERYKSFEAYLDGEDSPEPAWYRAGYEYLKKEQKANGSWAFGGRWSGTECATAFSVLFLLRSTQQSIKAHLGEGTLVGGRGLPRDLSKVRLDGAKLVVTQQPTEVDKLLDLLSETSGEALEGLIDDPAALRVGEVRPEDARRLQQIVRSGTADARLLAVRALAKMRNLDYVPAMIYALTDPDRRIVREARDGLRFVSRRFDGFGLDDNFDDGLERDQAIDRWKRWYRTVRPEAPPIP